MKNNETLFIVQWKRDFRIILENNIKEYDTRQIQGKEEKSQ